jgi:hypothetical protein
MEVVINDELQGSSSSTLYNLCLIIIIQTQIPLLTSAYSCVHPMSIDGSEEKSKRANFVC